MFGRQSFQFTPTLVLRIGLGFVFIYAGLYKLLDPLSWAGFIPVWLLQAIPQGVFLAVHGVFELVTGFTILLGFKMAFFASLACVNLLAIVLFYGITDTTFRDLGLFMAALALFLLYTQGKQS